MKMITKEIATKLQRNFVRQREDDEYDQVPPLKLFNPAGAGTWIISEQDPDQPDFLFGLCDLGFGTPELGSVSLGELASVRLPFGLTIERDRWFAAEQPLSVYAEAARQKSGITEDTKDLLQARAALVSRKELSA